ncbi:hypothetical protein FOL47_009805 [Perkinsus chesapeaki]|uniref:Methylated-DNA--protein-cysteine methyltransferase n=2 Tax=Alveolata TaxID=33630 RepID=A0A7J6MR83_PERCH|nr:hypothetical protein FOL47_009805 [Perkinsus chesapeaki]
MISATGLATASVLRRTLLSTTSLATRRSFSAAATSAALNEKLTPEEQAEKQRLIKELTRKLAGPLADENGNVPTGKDRPIAIEVDGPSHFYANSTKYTAYTKLKHRLLSRMGYKVLHVPYFEWRKLRGAKEREEYMRTKLKEEPTEWLDPEDEKYYAARHAEMVKIVGESELGKDTPSPVLRLSRMSFDLTSVSSFRRRVYEALLEVPKGKVTTYKRLSERIGCRSSQAIGQALKCNPFAPDVPCHRVVRSSLQIGGFHGQTDLNSEEVRRKISLLRGEGVQIIDDGAFELRLLLLFAYPSTVSAATTLPFMTRLSQNIKFIIFDWDSTLAERSGKLDRAKVLRWLKELRRVTDATIGIMTYNTHGVASDDSLVLAELESSGILGKYIYKENIWGYLNPCYSREDLLKRENMHPIFCGDITSKARAIGRLANSAGLRPEEILYIDDSFKQIEHARALGTCHTYEGAYKNLVGLTDEDWKSIVAFLSGPVIGRNLWTGGSFRSPSGRNVLVKSSRHLGAASGLETIRHHRPVTSRIPVVSPPVRVMA